jgi:hypothetical protein
MPTSIHTFQKYLNPSGDPVPLNILIFYLLLLEHVGALDVDGFPVGNIQPLVQPLLLNSISHKSFLLKGALA